MSVLQVAIAKFLEIVEFGEVVSAPGKLGIGENLYSRQRLDYPFVAGLLEIWPGKGVVRHLTKSGQVQEMTDRLS
jgi:hypothetical protein